MKRLFLPILVVVSAFSNPADAAPRRGDTGLGVIFGDPTGITAKFWQGRDEAIDATIAYSFGDFILLYGDYLWHFPRLFGTAPKFISQLSPYIGAGGVLWISSDDNRSDDKLFTEDGSVGFGFRLPLGIEWQPSRPPLGIFLEITPGVGVIPKVFGFAQGGIGIRVYF